LERCERDFRGTPAHINTNDFVLEPEENPHRF
jgi:hypothetical protein